MFFLLFHAAVSVFAQFSLNGTIKGAGEPLSGASVMLKNSFNGKSTSPDGSFVFKNLRNGSYKVLVSYLGFESRQFDVTLVSDTIITFDLYPEVVMTEEVLVLATRVKVNSPFAYSSVSKDEITQRNTGQDIPYLLQLTPSLVATSDAGTGIGYTNFRIRGTDMNRINVTLNGIPVNDAESHGTWFVDQPDLASSLENVQIQRGVGTSTNGAATFGASINLQINTFKKELYGEFKTAFGSFNTFKNTVTAGSGLLKGKFTVDTRLSKISSDGYIDRATSDLESYFISGSYLSDNTILKINAFSGQEKTYQAWNGIPSDILKQNRTYNDAGMYIDEKGNTLYYKNEIDNYRQDNYQLHFSHKFNETFSFTAASYYTHGKGYYENLKTGAKYADYGLPDITIK